MTQTLPITKAREELTTLVEDAKNKLAEFVITVNGAPAAVLISAAEYESWKETNEIMSNPDLVKAIRRGEKDIAQGNIEDWEDIKKEFELANPPYVSAKTSSKSKRRI